MFQYQPLNINNNNVDCYMYRTSFRYLCRHFVCEIVFCHFAVSFWCSTDNFLPFVQNWSVLSLLDVRIIDVLLFIDHFCVAKCYFAFWCKPLSSSREPDVLFHLFHVTASTQSNVVVVCHLRAFTG